jgi:hypothetical protein
VHLSELVRDTVRNICACCSSAVRTYPTNRQLGLPMEGFKHTQDNAVFKVDRHAIFGLALYAIRAIMRIQLCSYSKLTLKFLGWIKR